jgi:esterase/lipase superfamily enzyme
MNERRLLPGVALLTTMLFFTAQGDSQNQRSETSSIAPSSIARSTLFHLQANDTLGVTVESQDARFGVDLYVYNSAKELVGKNDEDSTTTLFSWIAPIAGDYYVLARNLGDAAGSLTVIAASGKGQIPSVLPTYAKVKIFFATDRTPTGKSAVSERFGTEPEKEGALHLGECTVSIPRDHRMGELEGPNIWKLEVRTDPERHITLMEIDPEERPLFFRSLSARTNRSRRKELFVFIPGFNTTFEDAARRTAQIAYDLGFDGPAVFYSWPSQGSKSPIAYNMDGTNAELTVPHLRQFLQDLLDYSGAPTIHLIAHSMGNRPLTNALREMETGSPTKKYRTFDQVVLMAPDIDASIFRQLAKDISPSAQRITMYASSRDEALKLSNSIAGYPRAGQGGSQILIVKGMDSIDASSVDTSVIGLYHQYYADNSSVLSDLFYLFRDQPPDNRFGLIRETTRDGNYWELKPVR